MAAVREEVNADRERESVGHVIIERRNSSENRFAREIVSHDVTDNFRVARTTGRASSTRLLVHTYIEIQTSL